MWPLHGPEHTFFTEPKIANQEHESYIGREQFFARSCARMICSAQDGGPIKDQKNSRQQSTGFEACVFSVRKGQE